jgi:hypothetical protein
MLSINFAGDFKEELISSAVSLPLKRKDTYFLRKKEDYTNEN